MEGNLMGEFLLLQKHDGDNQLARTHVIDKPMDARARRSSKLLLGGLDQKSPTFLSRYVTGYMNDFGGWILLFQRLHLGIARTSRTEHDSRCAFGEKCLSYNMIDTEKDEVLEL